MPTQYLYTPFRGDEDPVSAHGVKTYADSKPGSKVQIHSNISLDGHYIERTLKLFAKTPLSIVKSDDVLVINAHGDNDVNVIGSEHVNESALKQNNFEARVAERQAAIMRSQLKVEAPAQFATGTDKHGKVLASYKKVDVHELDDKQQWKWNDDGTPKKTTTMVKALTVLLSPLDVAKRLQKDGLPKSHVSIVLLSCYGAGNEMGVDGFKPSEPFAKELAQALFGMGYKKIEVTGYRGAITVTAPEPGKVFDFKSGEGVIYPERTEQVNGVAKGVTAKNTAVTYRGNG